MITICCVCKKLIEDNKITDGLISHGLCNECYQEEQRKLSVFILYHEKEQPYETI